MTDDSPAAPVAAFDFARELIEWRAWPSNRRPEEHPRVAPHSRKPPDDIDFEILDRLHINGAWADQTWIQCNECGKKNKFKEGGYLAAYADGSWYIIGPDCGEADHRARVNIKINAHLLREAEFAADESLRKFMEYRLEWRSYFDTLAETLQVAAALWKLVERHERFHEALRRSIRDDGKLTTRAGFYGRVAGGDFLLSQQSPFTKLRKLNNELSFLLQPISREEMNATLVSLNINGGLAKASETLRDQLRTLEEVRATILDAKRFAKKENLLLVSEWSATRGTDAPEPFLLTIEGDVISSPDPLIRQWTKLNIGRLTRFAAAPPY